MLYPPQTTEGLKTDWGGLVDTRGVVEKNGKSRNRRWTIVDLVIKGIRAWIVWRCPPLNCLRQMHPPPLHSHPQVPNLCIFETVFCKQYYFPKKSEPSFRQGKRIVYLDFWGVLPKKYEVSLANIWLSLLHLTFCTHCIFGAVHNKHICILIPPLSNIVCTLHSRQGSWHSLLSFYFKIYATQFTITNDIIVTAVLYHTSHRREPTDYDWMCWVRGALISLQQC